MRIKRLCKICGKEFIAVKSTQYFCSRKCFKKDYFLRQKIKDQEKQQKNKFPDKKCFFCGKISHLNFDPIKEPKRYNTWKCPNCGVTNEMLWKYQDEDNSYEFIKNILKKEEKISSKKIEYQVYYIPINYPEREKPEILTLTHKIIDMFSIKKIGRKKINFS